MLPLAAYGDRLSVRPGETIRFHAANATGQSVQAEVVRVICADANPAGPGIVTEPVAAQLTTLGEAGPQRAPQGSFAVLDGVAEVLRSGPDGGRDGGSFTLVCRVFPTLRTHVEQTIYCCQADAGPASAWVYLDGEGCPVVRLSDGTASVALRGECALALRRWHAVAVTVNQNASGAGRLTLWQVPIGDAMARDPGPQRQGAELTLGSGWALGLGGAGAPLLLAAAGPADQASAHWNGKLEAPMVFDRALTDAELSVYAAGSSPAGPVAAWDFAQAVATSELVDTGPHGLHGRLVNSPARGVTGSAWTGREMRYRDAPAEYGAIHFHADDLDDCKWPATFAWTVPADCRSAVYALMLQAGDARENVPFHVVPPRGEARARIAVLASTFTYTIYGNHARFEWDVNPQFRSDWHAQASEWGAYAHNPGDHREYGLSTYNDHLDGSGISIASWHRPMLNVRVGYITYPNEHLRASGLRHFPADTHLTAWLEAKGYDYDVLTDWELHTEGAELLASYPVVLTGSHPEYHTPAMIDALERYRDQGGRLCYLGGNGFYWKIAASPERDGVIEIRRGEGGIRAWAAEPGEYYNQFDGEYGGMWRRNGRPPQRLCGVGFTAQGNFSGSYYRKRAEAADPRVAWLFDGVEAAVFGGHGLSGHGAAGFELDRADKLLGTPEHALVVASSEDHPPEVPWVLVPEEMLTHLATWPGEPAAELIRADMTFFETPAGGAVFSVGSITFCGSLVTHGFDNDVSRLIDNVLRRFLDPARFEMPAR